MNLEQRICDLTGALVRMGGDQELLQKLMDIFREDSPDYIARLHTAVEEGDAQGVQHAAHSLNGLVSNFGAHAASLAAMKLEEMGRDGNLTSVAEAVAVLEDEILRLQTTLARESAALVDPA